MERRGRSTVPMPEPQTPWTGRTKDRLVARTVTETTPTGARLVDRAVRRAQEGDREAMRFLYLRYADNVYGYVRAIVRNHHDAEDVTQQVFAKLMTTIVKYEPREVPFVAWLLRISHNAAVDAVRARRDTPLTETYEPSTPTEDAGGDRTIALRTAFDRLPEDQRQVVVLRHVLGLTPVEIAACLGRTNSSVYGLHHRGRRAMCAELVKLDSTPFTARPHLEGVAA